MITIPMGNVSLTLKVKLGSGQPGDRKVEDLSGHDGVLAVGTAVISSEEEGL